MVSYAKQYRTFFYNLFRFGLKVSSNELKQIIITIIIVAFVWSFRIEGDTFVITVWLIKFLQGALFGTIAMFMNQIGQRIVAVYYGYDPDYEYGVIGLMIAIVVTFASRGLLVFFLPGAISIRHLAASRLGEFRYYTNDWEWAKAGFMGPFLNITFAIMLSPLRDIPFVRQLMFMNVLFAIYSLIPLPGNVGLYLFYPHIYFWTFTLGIVVASSIMVFFLNPFLTLFIGLVGGIFAMYWHFVVKDNKLSI